MRAFVCTRLFAKQPRGAVLAGAATLLASAFVGCSAPKPRPEPELDCLQEEGYDLSAVTPTDGGARIYWYGFGDETPGAYDGFQDGMRPEPPSVRGPCNPTLNVPELSRPPEPYGLAQLFSAPTVCGRTATLRLKGYGHKDWGGGWATVLMPRTGFIGANGENSAAFQGIAFWAKSEKGHDKTIVMEVSTAQTAKPREGVAALLPDPAYANAPPEERCGKFWKDEYGDPILLVKPDGKPLTDEDGHALRDDPRDCKAAATDEGAATYRLDSNGNLVASSSVPKPDECGNSFVRQVTVSEHWQLYLYPFESFYQEALPNRDPHGMDPSHIYQVIFRAEKEKDIDIWMDGLSFYREVGWEPPGGLAGAGGQSSTSSTGSGGAGGAN